MTAVPSVTRSSVPANEPREPVQAPWLLFGDAVAIVDRGLGILTWASPDWLTAQPRLHPGTTIDSITEALPQTALLLHGDKSPADSQGAVTATSTNRWTVESQVIDDRRIAVRLTDRHEHGRAMQRQLDDRESLLFTSRVLSVGEMATTLAHELNQPIAAAANLLRGLRSRLSRRADPLERNESAALDRTIEQVMFASQVIARIRDFTQSHRPRPTQFDLAALLRNSASLLDWDLQRAGVALTLKGTGRPINIHGDKVMLQQVVINLMRNAIDALRNDPPAAPSVTVRLVARNRRAEVQVTDNGCGLDDATAEKLFVPFASSKPNGMGLGLSICRSFIELHQGRLWFSRNRDAGTTFHIALPTDGPDKPICGAAA